MLITFLGPISISSGPEEYQYHLHGFLDGLQDISNLGHKLTEKGVEPDQSKVEAIKGMPRPVDKAALQRCFGMLNNPNLSETVLPLRDLTKQDAVLYCLTRMKTLSVRQGNSLHQLLSCTEYYDCSPSPVTLQVDAFLQDNQPVRFTSHSLDAKERNCAQIEKECLAIVTCNNKWHQYLSERAISQFIPTISP